LTHAQVSLGDFVEVYSGEKDDRGDDVRPWIMEVTELFEEVQVTISKAGDQK